LLIVNGIVFMYLVWWPASNWHICYSSIKERLSWLLQSYIRANWHDHYWKQNKVW